MNELRCKKCGKLLAKHEIDNGLVELYCKGCRTKNTFSFGSVKNKK